jgi:hypothetical protein
MFTVIKLVNHQLNKMFDTNKIITSEKVIKMPKRKKPDKKRIKQRKQTQVNNPTTSNTEQLLVSDSSVGVTGVTKKWIGVNSKKRLNSNQSNAILIDETVLDSENTSFDKKHPNCIDNNLWIGSVKSAKPKNNLDLVHFADLHTKRYRNGLGTGIKGHFPMASCQAEGDTLLNNTDGLLNETSFNEVSESDRDIERADKESKIYHSKVFRKTTKKPNVLNCPDTNESCYLSLSSPSKIIFDRKKSDNYEPANCSMVDLDYSANASDKTSNLSDPNLVAFTASLNQSKYLSYT